LYLWIQAIVSQRESARNQEKNKCEKLFLNDHKLDLLLSRAFSYAGANLRRFYLSWILCILGLNSLTVPDWASLTARCWAPKKGGGHSSNSIFKRRISRL